MADRSWPGPGVRMLLVLAAFVVLIWGIQAAQSFIVMLLLAVFFAIIGASPVRWLEQRRVPSVAAVLVVVFVIMAFLFGLGVLVGTSVNRFTQTLPSYQAAVREKMAALFTWLTDRGIQLSPDMLLSRLDPGEAMKLAAGLLSGLGAALTNVVLILLLTVFLLLEVSGIPAKLRAALDNPHAAFPQFRTFVRQLNRYLLIKTSVSLATGLLIGSWLAVIGVDFPVLWGLLAFLLNFIPNIGSIIAAVPAVLLALIQAGAGTAALAAAGFLVVNFVLGNIVEPRVMGKGLGLSALVVFLSLLFWGSLLGPVGMILSVPITMSLKLALAVNPDTAWIAVLLGATGQGEGRAAEPQEWGPQLR